MNRDYDLLAVVGPTACGKTRQAVAIAETLDGEIISGDSRQVYRGMDLGTGKDLQEYGKVKAHLIDICDAGEKYNLFRFLSDFNHAYHDIRERGRFPVLCGGSGMYVEAALNGIIMPEVERNEELRRELAGKSLEELTSILEKGKNLHNKTDVDTIQRALRAIEIMRYYEEHPDEAAAADRQKSERPRSLIIGLDIPRDERRRRISQRLETRLKDGMVEEVERLIRDGVKPSDLIYYGLEYKFVTQYVIGELTYDEMKTGLETAIHQFAKRQMTWWRGMEKRGHRIHWFPYDIPSQELVDEIRKIAFRNA